MIGTSRLGKERIGRTRDRGICRSRGRGHGAEGIGTVSGRNACAGSAGAVVVGGTSVLHRTGGGCSTLLILSQVGEKSSLARLGKMDTVVSVLVGVRRIHKRRRDSVQGNHKLVDLFIDLVGRWNFSTSSASSGLLLLVVSNKSRPFALNGNLNTVSHFVTFVGRIVCSFFRSFCLFVGLRAIDN